MRIVGAALAAALVFSLGAAAPATGAETVRVYFDNDFLGPGQSNIQAMIPLLRDPRVELLGVGVVTGDAWLQEETQHLLRFLEIVGRPDVPVAKGAEMPLIRTQGEMRAWEQRYGAVPWKGAWNAPRPGRSYHPEDPALVPPMPEGEPHIAALPEDAAHLLIRLVRAHPGEVTVITAGPLTNIALALRLAPDLPSLAKEIVIEGGGLDMAVARVTGNTDYATDFNFIFDPEAAHIVLTAPWKRVTLLGNVTGSAKVTPELVAQVASAGTPMARYFHDYAKVGQPLWDEMTTAVALDRSLATEELVARMDVDLMPGPDYGNAQIWKDEFAPHQGEQTVHVIQKVDVARFLASFTAQARR
ncbi:nucleoside hydrolase [Azospirillum sp. B4]|uniref:nucleoside hydrolase n=1 Tax=Azospirillum sp. B4 TaxID=95605 RepID=UPI000345BCA1|nr:nucleoside hydrolase [Azospirillum sp. B4]